jgi:hypothetical protein
MEGREDMAIKWVLMTRAETGLEFMECSLCKNHHDELWGLKTNEMTEKEWERFQALEIDPADSFWICEKCLGYEGRITRASGATIQTTPQWLNDYEKFKRIVRHEEG